MTTLVHSQTDTPPRARVSPLEWADGRLRVLDQTRLPAEVRYLELQSPREVAAAIREMRVRGAPAIGIAAAYGMALAARQAPTHDRQATLRHLEEAASELRAARPTAVNLAWATERVLASARGGRTPDEARRHALLEARSIHRQETEANERMGRLGAALLPAQARVLTHCNTGSLATGGRGTALAVVRAAWEEGKLRRVFATESRPLLQGARLTAWELEQEGIPTTLLVDSAAGALLEQARVAAVLVGADRIAANGDVANKIGTYSLAVLAGRHNVPFYVVAPASSIDPATARGEEIPVEERGAGEVIQVQGVSIAPAGVPAWNPAFDVTPAELVTAIVTEQGVVRPPYGEGLGRAIQQRQERGQPGP